MTVQEWLKNIEYNEDLISGVVEMAHGTQLIFDVRGWGYLSEKCNMMPPEAAQLQDDVGRFIVAAIQEKLAREVQS